MKLAELFSNKRQRNREPKQRPPWPPPGACWESLEQLEALSRPETAGEGKEVHRDKNPNR